MFNKTFSYKCIEVIESSIGAQLITEPVFKP